MTPIAAPHPGLFVGYSDAGAPPPLYTGDVMEDSGLSVLQVVAGAITVVAMYLAGLVTHALSIRDKREARNIDAQQAALESLRELVDTLQDRLRAVNEEVGVLREQNASLFNELAAMRARCVGCSSTEALNGEPIK